MFQVIDGIINISANERGRGGGRYKVSVCFSSQIVRSRAHDLRRPLSMFLPKESRFFFQPFGFEEN